MSLHVSIHLFFTANVLATSGIFYYFQFAILCKSINTELNANKIKLYTLYSAFQFLTLLMQELGLPLNWDKYTPPTRRLTCLGIVISISDFTLSIDQDKLDLIYQECLKVSKCRY